jgi:tetratricopeptide (TPR) repeat protein
MSHSDAEFKDPAGSDPRTDSLESMGVHAPSPEVQTLLQSALEWAEEEDWERVAESLRAALETHPEDPYLLCWLGMAERELGLEGVAQERFRGCLASNPRDPVLLATAGHALAALEDPAAEGALRTAALLGPRLPQARWMYGSYLAREGMFDDALQEFAAALEEDPDDPVIHTERGVTLAFMGRLPEAEAAFERVLEIDSEEGWVLVLLALTRFESALDRSVLESEMEEIAALLDQGARLLPEDLEAQLLAALAQGSLGDEDRALEMLERARLIAEEEDLPYVLEVEDVLDGTQEGALRLLTETLAPSSFRARLSVRP